jgi:flagellar biosynthesis anti-sigma factor FlgM
MEIPIIPSNLVQKTEMLKAPVAGSRKTSSAYSANKAESDAIQISSKSKLMQKLRKQYSDLEKQDKVKVSEIKDKLEKGTLELTYEELVTGILSGTLFETV